MKRGQRALNQALPQGKLNRAFCVEQQNTAFIPQTQNLSHGTIPPASETAPTPDSAEMMPASARSRIAAMAASSGMAVKVVAARSSSCQASRLGLPQAGAATIVSGGP